jgi:hypothetical protein
MAEPAATRRKLYQSKEQRLTYRDGEGRVRYHDILVASHWPLAVGQT